MPDGAKPRTNDGPILKLLMISADGAERIDLTALQVNLADEVLGDRVVLAPIERFADEVGLPAEARDVLLVIDIEAGGGIFAIVNIIVEDRKSGQRSDNIPNAAACLISTGASPLLKQLINGSGTTGIMVPPGNQV